MPSLAFSNVEFLQYSENMDFLDTAGFRLSSRREMSIKGELLALSNQDGIFPVISQVSGLRASLNQYYPDIYINGQNFGAGKMTSLNINSNDKWIKTAYYTANLQTIIRYDELSQEQFSSGVTTDYQGLNYLFTEQLPARFIRNLKEEYNYNRDNDVFGYTHTIAVSTFDVTDGLQRVKGFASSLFALTNPINAITTKAQQLDNANYKPIYNEKFDLLNNDFLFIKKLSAKNPDFTNNISQEQVINMTVSENGLATCSENGTIKSLTSSQPNLTPILAGVLGRMTGIFAAYNNESYALYPLNTGNPIINVFNYDQPNRTASYQVTYTNDPRYLSFYNWDYNIEIVKNGAFLSATERGKIIGSGNISTTMFNNALVGYQSITGGILSRLSPSLSAYYPSFSTLLKNPYQGTIEYSQTYTENPIFNQSTSGIITMEINLEDAFKTPLYNRYNVFNYGVIGQPLFDTTTSSIQGVSLASRTITIAIQGQKTSNETSLKLLAQNTANSYLPSGFNDIYLDSCSFVSEPIERVLTMNATWIYD